MWGYRNEKWLFTGEAEAEQRSAILLYPLIPAPSVRSLTGARSTSRHGCLGECLTDLGLLGGPGFGGEAVGALVRVADRASGEAGGAVRVRGLMRTYRKTDASHHVNLSPMPFGCAGFDAANSGHRTLRKSGGSPMPFGCAGFDACLPKSSLPRP